MSVEYSVTVHRNADNKIIGEFMANILKGIFDSEFCDIIHCNHREANDVKFTVSDVDNLIKIVKDKIKQAYQSIEINRTRLLIVDKENIRQEIKEKITYLEENIDSYFDVLYCAIYLNGMIYEVTENNIKLNSNKEDDFSNDIAYNYNGKDLPKDKDDYSVTIWADSVYCKIHAYY